MASKFNVGDKVVLQDKYTSTVKEDFIKGECLVISQVTKKQRSSKYVLKFLGDPRPNIAYGEFAFDFYKEPEDWSLVSEDEKKLFIRELIGSMYMDKKLYSAIKKLINNSNTQKKETL